MVVTVPIYLFPGEKVKLATKISFLNLFSFSQGILNGCCCKLTQNGVYLVTSHVSGITGIVISDILQ